jgi:2-pyrone-4,6-dicarboxylate lactonase
MLNGVLVGFLLQQPSRHCGQNKRMPEAVLTYMHQPSAPRLLLPPGACDAHVHVFGPAAIFPFSPDSAITPADAPKETLFALHRLLGIMRCVIVQSLVHGFDNTVVEDAICAGGGRYLGVALVPHQVSDAELQRLKAAGFRGVRFNFMQHQGPGATVQQVVALTQRLAPLGLHLQVHFESSLIHELAPVLRQSAVPVVIDHMARVDATLGENHADFRVLCALLEDPRFHVKLSGVDRVSPGAPYAEGVALARRLLQEFPERCFWGTDWPHPNHHHVPDDGQLVDLLAMIAPTSPALEALLVHNPQRFYNFDA